MAFQSWNEVQCRCYRAWEKFILLWAIYSSFFTPFEFGFFRGLPRNLFLLDIAGQIAFVFDIVLQFFVAYRERQTYKMIDKRSPIALRSVFSSLPIFIQEMLNLFQFRGIYFLIFFLYNIFWRYLKSYFIIDLLGCLPWDILYRVLLFVSITIFFWGWCTYIKVLFPWLYIKASWYLISLISFGNNSFSFLFLLF